MSLCRPVADAGYQFAGVRTNQRRDQQSAMGLGWGQPWFFSERPLATSHASPQTGREVELVLSVGFVGEQDRLRNRRTHAHWKLHALRT